MHFKALLLSASLAAALRAPRAADPSVTIASGVLVGTASAVSNQLPTQTLLATAYLGIPYAASPTRFAPPSAPTSWATKTVKTLKPVCYQQFPSGTAGSTLRSIGENPFGPTPLPQAEDCLNVNVFVPPNTNRQSAKAILFYIYGGNLEAGGNSLQEYNGSALAVDQDVIVVIPNYRTNFFGFSNSPDIPFGKQNSGLLDLHFALTWVQNNIGAFGGNASEVTIFGQSGGGFAVKQLITNPPNPLTFRAGIMQSSAHEPGNGPAAFKNISTHFGCNNPPSGQTQTDCLRKVAATDIITYITNYNVHTDPVQGDGTYSGYNSLGQLLNKTFADVPLLVGTNLDELSVFIFAAGLNNQSAIAPSILQLTGIDISNLTLTPALYPGQSGSLAILDRIGTDLTFTCPNSIWSSAYASNAKSSVYRYRFDGIFKSTQYFQGAGAYHQSEVPEVWGTYWLQTKYGSADPVEIALSKYMQGIWAGFAKSPYAKPDPAWSPYKTSDALPTLGVLGGSNNTSGLNTQPSVYTDYACPVYFPILFAAGFAY